MAERMCACMYMPHDFGTGDIYNAETALFLVTSRSSLFDDGHLTAQSPGLMLGLIDPIFHY